MGQLVWRLGGQNVKDLQHNFGIPGTCTNNTGTLRVPVRVQSTEAVGMTFRKYDDTLRDTIESCIGINGVQPKLKSA